MDASLFAVVKSSAGRWFSAPGFLFRRRLRALVLLAVSCAAAGLALAVFFGAHFPPGGGSPPFAPTGAFVVWTFLACLLPIGIVHGPVCGPRGVPPETSAAGAPAGGLEPGAIHPNYRIPDATSPADLRLSGADAAGPAKAALPTPISPTAAALLLSLAGSAAGLAGILAGTGRPFAFLAGAISQWVLIGAWQCALLGCMYLFSEVAGHIAARILTAALVCFLSASFFWSGPLLACLERSEAETGDGGQAAVTSRGLAEFCLRSNPLFGTFSLWWHACPEGARVDIVRAPLMYALWGSANRMVSYPGIWGISLDDGDAAASGGTGTAAAPIVFSIFAAAIGLAREVVRRKARRAAGA
ncbi:MAG: hypothetical protein N3A38_05015 [Planctomycetota bacterium]|nr:hypothetical protein [Planctomycetota bacterium]